MLTYFWRVNRKQQVRKLRRSKRNCSPLFITFFYVITTSKAITSDFSSAPDNSTSEQRRRQAALLRPCIYRFCFARTSALAYCVGSSKASQLVGKPAQFKYFEHVMWWKELSGYKGNIPFYSHGCRSCYLPPLTHAYARDKKDKGLALPCFSSKT